MALNKLYTALACIAAVGCAASERGSPSGTGETSTDIGASAVGRTPAARIAAALKQKIEHRSASEMKVLLQRAYIKTHLMDQRGKWRLAALEPMTEKLLPNDLSIPRVLGFIDRIASNLENNPYAVSFLKQAEAENFSTLFGKFNAEGDEVIPQVVAWAIALENITKAELDEPSLIEALSNFWINEREKEGASPIELGLFGAIKLASVEAPIKKIIEFHKSRKLDPKFLQGMLPLNISQAITADVVMGNTDNAAAGWPLFTHAPAAEANPKLGTGFATFSGDQKRIEVRMALPKEWADLYQVWNMAFVSQIDNYPFWIAKLLIPQVSDYKDYPEEYIYRRALALYTAEHYIFLGGRDDKRAGVPTINWPDKSLTAFWGKANKSAAGDYERDVERQR